MDPCTKWETTRFLYVTRDFSVLCVPDFTGFFKIFKIKKFYCGKIYVIKFTSEPWLSVQFRGVEHTHSVG